MNEDWVKLTKEMNGCKKCGLHKTRTNVVIGDGPPSAEILILGEAPGFWEDKLQKPFCGAAGKFLDELLSSAGMKREDIYVTNVLKCRPVAFPAFQHDFCILCKKCEECHPTVFKER